jgi:hypothetical protein
MISSSTSWATAVNENSGFLTCIPAADKKASALGIRVSDNLQSAWLAEASGTRAASMRRTVCSITVGSEKTFVAICSHGSVIDTAALDLGSESLRFSGDPATTIGLIVSYISDGGETFLDAVAKRIKIGDRIEERMIELIGELIAETFINLTHRAKPPQVSQRLLSTEPLYQHHNIDEYWISGAVAKSILRRLKGDAKGLGPLVDLTAALANGIIGGLNDRQIVYRVVPNELACDPQYEEHPAMLVALGRSDATRVPLHSVKNAPVLRFSNLAELVSGSFWDHRCEEFLRRHELKAGAPYVLSSAAGHVRAAIALAEGHNNHIVVIEECPKDFAVESNQVPVVGWQGYFSENDYLSVSVNGGDIKSVVKRLSF